MLGDGAAYGCLGSAEYYYGYLMAKLSLNFNIAFTARLCL